MKINVIHRGKLSISLPCKTFFYMLTEVSESITEKAEKVVCET